MSTKSKITLRNQVLENYTATTEDTYTYEIDNSVIQHNGTRFSLAPNTSTEFTLDSQTSLIKISSDNPVVIVTDNNDTTGTSNFTVDSNTDIVFLTKSLYPWTSQAVTLTTTGVLPDPLATNTTYYVISRDHNEILLATSKVNAQAGTAINITDVGTGIHTLDLTASYTQSIDDSAQSLVLLMTGSNVKRITIKNNGSSIAVGKLYTSRGSI